MEPEPPAFDTAIHAHDQALASRGLPLWIGAEPTFTDPRSELPEWLHEALGSEKLRHARCLLARLRDAMPGAMILRSLGRQYAGESRPRWSLGLYARRDGQALWTGPPDPIIDAVEGAPGPLEAFWEHLARALTARGWPTVAFRLEAELGLRLLFRLDGTQPRTDPAADSRLQRGSLHAQAIPLTGARDELAAQGDYLLLLGALPLGPAGESLPCLELPRFGDVEVFFEFLDCVAGATRAAGLPALVWQGFPPPVDQRVAWTTLTPDPAVLEINQAPAPDVTGFLAAARQLHALVQDDGLAPYRLQYNGTLSESGGGGQFTLGGPSPEQSPFFQSPQLLPRLVRYHIRHPALSFWFAPPYVGSASQSPRPDEGVRESFNELTVALEQLDRLAAPEPEMIWRTLSPFLVDPAGNSHRAELNIEKLWNPYLPERGCLGLVEYRAFRMTRSPERAAAIAALLRTVAAMLSAQDRAPELTDWGPLLHDRFALPFYLRQDLDQVLADLEAAGLGLDEPITRVLRQNDLPTIGTAELEGRVLTLEHALEFWPLLGDTASQETGTSRLVDASTARLQLCLRSPSQHPEALEGWRLLVGKIQVPLRSEHDALGPARVFGLRYRSFVPGIGLHPSIGAQGPLELTLLPPSGTRALRITLHEWHPDGLPYPGLPATLEEAQARRSARFRVQGLALDRPVRALDPPSRALTDHCLDLRRL